MSGASFQSPRDARISADPPLDAKVRAVFASVSPRFLRADGIYGAGALPSIVFPDPIDAALQPFWHGTEMVETLTFLRLNPHAPPQARPLFRPDTIHWFVSVTRDIAYEQGRDYLLDAATGMLTLPPGSRIPFKTFAELIPFVEQKLPFAYDDARLFHFRQVEIAYRHAPGLWRGPMPEPAMAQLPRTLAKLKAHAPLRLLVLGDSISQGAGASRAIKVAPGLPDYVEQVVRGIERASGSTVALDNRARGGWAAQSGAHLAATERPGRAAPDLVLIAFGMNDITFMHSGYADRYGLANYTSSIASATAALRADAPGCEFILISSMFGNGENALFPPADFLAFRDALRSLTGPGVALADVTGLLEAMLKAKSWYDLTYSGINHPNDFMHRIYAQAILALLIGE